MNNELLQQGDVIDLKEGHKVYAMLPSRLIFVNSTSDELRSTMIKIGDPRADLAGRYVVTHTVFGGGCGGHDPYPNGHQVFCQRADGTKVNFYQSGAFTAVNKDVPAVGRAVLRWEVEQS